MGLIALPQRFTSQPQYSPRLAPAYQDAQVLYLMNGEVAARDLANGNNLIPQASSPTPDVAPWGRTLSFDGSTGHLKSTRVLSIGNAFTVFAWVRPTGALSTGYSRILDADYTTGFYLGSNTGSQYAWIVNNSSLEGCIGGQQVLGQRDLVCGTFDGATRRLYVNDAQVASAAATAPATTQYLNVGRLPSGPLWLGNIDTVGVFNRAFSASEVAALYANPWQMFRATPRRLWAAATAGGSVGSSSGVAAVSGVGASLNAQPGLASGIASVSGVGSSLFSGVGSSSGIATVAGVGSVAGSSGSASGVASVNGVGASLVASVASSAGIASVSGVGASSASDSVGSASGLASVSGVGASVSASVGSAGGVSAASGISLGSAQIGGHFAGVGYHKQPKRREHKKDDEIRQELIRQIEGEQAEIEQSAAPVEVKAQVARIVKPYVEEPESVDIATLQQDLTRVKQLLEHWQAEVQGGIDEDEELLFMFH